MTFYLSILLSILPLGLVMGEYAWIERSNGYEGLVNIGSNELNVCLEQCLYLEYCRVAGYDNSTNSCYLQMEKDLKTLPNDEKSTLKFYEFRRVEFYNGDICWTKLPETKIKGLTKLSYGPLSICMRYCIGSFICSALTIDTESDPPCFVQISKDASNLDKDSYEFIPTATSYVLDKACLAGIKFLSE